VNGEVNYPVGKEDCFVSKSRYNLIRTRKLREAVEACGEQLPSQCKQGNVFPEEFLCGIRNALEAGLSCDEMVGVLLLLTRLHEVLDEFGSTEFLSRVSNIVAIIQEDIDYLDRMRDLRRRVHSNLPPPYIGKDI